MNFRLEGEAGRYRAIGSLTFATARTALTEVGARIAGDREVYVDLSGVSAADSAGLALLIEWYCAAERAQHSIRFGSVPESLRALAKISDVDQFLPFD